MRARNIKPGFFENEYLAELSAHARLLFIGLWCLADREGRIENRPARIHGQLFPYEQDIDVVKLLDELAKCHEQFITLYISDGKPYIQVNGFLDHQKPHPNEKSSVIPPASQGVPSLHTKERVTREVTRTNPADIMNDEYMNDECQPTKPSKKSPSKKTTVPDSFPINPEMLLWAKDKHSVSDIQWLNRETEKFLNYNRANGRKQVDWIATWRNWVIKALEYQAPKNNVQALPTGERFPGLSHQLKQVGG